MQQWSTLFPSRHIESIKMTVVGRKCCSFTDFAWVRRLLDINFASTLHQSARHLLVVHPSRQLHFLPPPVCRSSSSMSSHFHSSSRKVGRRRRWCPIFQGLHESTVHAIQIHKEPNLRNNLWFQTPHFFLTVCKLSDVGHPSAKPSTWSFGLHCTRRNR